MAVSRSFLYSSGCVLLLLIGFRFLSLDSSLESQNSIFFLYPNSKQSEFDKIMRSLKPLYDFTTSLSTTLQISSFLLVQVSKLSFIALHTHDYSHWKFSCIRKEMVHFFKITFCWAKYPSSKWNVKPFILKLPLFPKAFLLFLQNQVISNSFYVSPIHIFLLSMCHIVSWSAIR